MISQVNDTEPINEFLKHIIYIQHKLPILDNQTCLFYYNYYNPMVNSQLKIKHLPVHH